MKWQRLVVLVLTGVGLASGCGDDGSKENSSSPSSGGDAATPSSEAGAPAQTDAAAASDAGASSDATASDAAASTDAAVASDTDYSKPANWLCRPENNAACAVDLNATVVKADGTLEAETFKAATAPAIDCFYVYPTVSLDATANSDLVPGPEENNVVRAQFARFGQQCRLFAPMYRQVTLTSLRASLGGMASTADRALGYRDVLAAWQYYLKNDNKGRGVVLVGHSQGSGVLLQLLTQQIDPDPSKVPFIAAYLIGTNVMVPEGQVVGGSLKKIPICKSAAELGCVISYVSFRAAAPPPANSLFGRSMMAGQVVACANPAALGGGAAELDAYLSREGAGASGKPMGPWLSDASKTVTTPFVKVPGLLSGECKTGPDGSYLAVTVKGDPADPRVDEIVGDVVTNDMVQANWGLHLIDVHMGMGNLLSITKAKADAFKAR